MIKKYKKTTSWSIYIILFTVALASVLVTYGLTVHIFTFNTGFLVHCLFIASGILFIFSSIILILDMLVEEGVEYIVSEKGLFINHLIAFKSPLMEWDKINSFHFCSDKNGKIYTIEDTAGNEVILGEKINNINDLIEEICRRACIEAQECKDDKKYTSWDFKTSKEAGYNPYSRRLKIHNIFNIILIIFLLILSFLLQEKLLSDSENLKYILLGIQCIMGILLLITFVNLGFYKYWLTRSTNRLSELLLLFINSVIITFFVMTIVYLMHFYHMSYELAYFYPEIGRASCRERV